MFSEQILFVPVFRIRIRKEMLRIRTLVSTIVKKKLPFSTAIKGIVQRIVRGVEASQLISLKPPKTVVWSSCDGVPLKLKKKNDRPFSLPGRIF
jgi:hypothetical protein